jgi:hypothetical protein
LINPRARNAQPNIEASKTATAALGQQLNEAVRDRLGVSGEIAGASTRHNSMTFYKSSEQLIFSSPI